MHTSAQWFQELEIGEKYVIKAYKEIEEYHERLFELEQEDEQLKQAIQFLD